MKTKKVINILLCVLLISSFVFTGNPAFAASAKENKSSLNVKSLSIPKDVIQYAEDISGPLLFNVVTSDLDFGIDTSDYQNWVLGTPFIIFSMDMKKTANCSTYYFPVLNKNDIILMICVTKTNDEFSASISKDLAAQLNELRLQQIDNDSSQYIVYTSGGALFAEKEGKAVKLADTNLASNSNNSFKEKTYKDKVKDIESKYNNKLITTNIYEQSLESLNPTTYSYTPTVTITNYSDYIQGMLNTSVVGLVTQQDSAGNWRNMCWAACVANTVRYLQGSTTLTACNVCDKMGIGYDTGASLVQTYQALVAYNVTNYYTKGFQISFANVTTNINNKYPVIMGASGVPGGHMTTLIGYKDYYTGSDYIYFHNPGTGSIVLSVFSTGGTTYSYGGYTFTWNATLSPT